MRFAKFIGVAFLLSCAAAMVWTVVSPPAAEDVGFPVDDPSYLLGCYHLEGAEIRLENDFAVFGETQVSISFGQRKTLREVLYPRLYPWFNLATGEFKFENDRFDLIDMIETEDGNWEIQIRTTDYLASKQPSDLKTVYFRKGECRDTAISARKFGR